MRSHILPYNPTLKNLARQLRKNSTLAEVILWQQLKGKARRGTDFHRQKPIGDYIVDFFCPQLMLAIEIDGTSHDGKMEADLTRQKQLENLGIVFLRFTDHDVKCNTAGVVAAIEAWIAEHNTPRPNGHPSQEG